MTSSLPGVKNRLLLVVCPARPVPACLARANVFSLDEETEPNAAPVGSSDRTGKFLLCILSNHDETWLPARRAGQGSGQRDDAIVNDKTCAPARRAGKGREKLK